MGLEWDWNEIGMGLVWSTKAMGDGMKRRLLTRMTLVLGEERALKT